MGKKRSILDKARERQGIRRSRKEAEAQRQRNLGAFLTARETLAKMRQGILDSGARRDSCILSTKLYCELGSRMSFRVAEMAVEACAMNVPASRVAHDIDDYSGSEAACSEIARRLVREKGHMVVLGDPRAEGDGWTGHLVAVIETPEGLVGIDLSLDQASRPKKLMVLRPVSFPVTDEWLNGETVARLRLNTVDGDVLVDYRARPFETGYLESPDWTRTYNPILSVNENGIQFNMECDA